jgi:fluoride ion exporter CrcB/FEX
LSFGVLNQVIVCMVQAQRRLLAGVRASLVVAALFFFLWTPAALKWKVPGALIAGLVISFATASVFIATAFTSPTERRRFYLRDYLFPLLTSVTTAAIGWFAGRQAIEWWSAGPWLNAVIICVVTGGLYSWLIHLVSPVATQELLARAGEFLKPSVTRLART